MSGLARAALVTTTVWLVLAASPVADTGATVEGAFSVPLSIGAHGDTSSLASERPELLVAPAMAARGPAARSLAGRGALSPAAAIAPRDTLVVAQAASLDQVLTNIRNLILGLAGGAALVCWSVAGLRMMFSQGDPGEVAKARSAFRAGAVGFAVVILAPLALAVLRTVVGL